MTLIEIGGSKYIKKAFELSAVSCKGYLTPNEYKRAIIILFGIKPSKRESGVIFGSDKSKKLTLKDFTDIVQQKSNSCDRWQHFHEAFMIIDNDNKGFLVPEDLIKAQENVLPNLNRWVLEKSFAAWDLNNDGRIGYRDFQNIMSFDFTNFKFPHS